METSADQTDSRHATTANAGGLSTAEHVANPRRTMTKGAHWEIASRLGWRQDCCLKAAEMASEQRSNKKRFKEVQVKLLSFMKSRMVTLQLIALSFRPIWNTKV